MVNDSTNLLLPPTAPKVLRDVLKSLNFDDVMNPGIDAVAFIKWPEPNPDFLDWLLHELSLSQFAQYRTNPRALYFEGRRLNQLKGTKAAVRMVAYWLGFHRIEIRTLGQAGVHFPEFQIGLGDYPKRPTDLCKLLDAVNRVKPLRSRLRRVWHGYDVPMFVPSQSPWGDLLGDYSGLHSTDLGLCLSPDLCTQDVRISLRAFDDDLASEGGIEIVGEYDRTTVFDAEVYQKLIEFPTPSRDFSGLFYPLGFGAIGELEHEEDNSGYLFDGNVDWTNLDWVNEDWTQDGFGLVGESDTFTILSTPPGAIISDPATNVYIVTDTGTPIIYA